MEDLSFSYSSLNVINSTLPIEEKIAQINHLFKIEVKVDHIEIDFTDFKNEESIEYFNESLSESFESSLTEQSTLEIEDNVQVDNIEFKSFIDSSDYFYSQLQKIHFSALEHAGIDSKDFLSFSLAGICLRICLDEGIEFNSCENKVIELIEKLNSKLNKAFQSNLFGNSESEIKFLLLYYGVDLSKNLLSTIMDPCYCLGNYEEDENNKERMCRQRCNYIRSLFVALFVHFNSCLKSHSFPKMNYNDYLKLREVTFSFSTHQKFADVETEAILYINEYLNSYL